MMMMIIIIMISSSSSSIIIYLPEEDKSIASLIKGKSGEPVCNFFYTLHW
jgi:hypothetical protein